MPDLPEIPEAVIYASPLCAKCGGSGFVRMPEVLELGRRWCDCALQNYRQRKALGATKGGVRG